MTKKRMNALLKIRDSLESLLFATNELKGVMECEEDGIYITDEDRSIMGEYAWMLDAIGNPELQECVENTQIGQNIGNSIDEWEKNHFDEEGA